MQLPLYGNLVIQLWHTIPNFKVLCHVILQCFKLANITNVFILKNVKYERCFSSLKVLKSNLHNRLGPNPLTIIYDDVLAKIHHIISIPLQACNLIIEK